MDYFIKGFQQFATFTGRSTRKDYWMFVLLYSIIYVALVFLDGMMGSIWMSSLFSLIVLIPSTSYGARRLHDMGKSGWWQLVYFVPLFGLIVMLVFLSKDSQPFDNKYGPNPKDKIDQFSA